MILWICDIMKIRWISYNFDYNLKNEIDDIKSVCEQIKVAYSNGKGPKWIVIAVNKVDLFYNNVNDAQKYYSIN